MTREIPNKEFIQAFLDGKEVQVDTTGDGAWCDVTHFGAFMFYNDHFRIKPDPKKFRVYQANERAWFSVFVVRDQVAAELVERGHYFKKWVSDWIEYDEDRSPPEAKA